MLQFYEPCKERRGGVQPPWEYDFGVGFQRNSDNHLCSNKVGREAVYYWPTPKRSSCLDFNHILSLKEMI